LFPIDTRGLGPVRYGGVLLSASLHASVALHNLLNVPLPFTNKMGFQKKKKMSSPRTSRSNDYTHSYMGDSGLGCQSVYRILLPSKQNTTVVRCGDYTAGAMGREMDDTLGHVWKEVVVT
jgi:hypothetical protein